MKALGIVASLVLLAWFERFILKVLHGPSRQREDFNPDGMSDSWRRAEITKGTRGTAP